MDVHDIEVVKRHRGSFLSNLNRSFRVSTAKSRTICTLENLNVIEPLANMTTMVCIS